MLVKYLIATAALAAAIATATGSAFAAADTLQTARAGSVAYHKVNTALAGHARMHWTADQLRALANAYRAKNPGWRAPMSSDVHFPADLTWTSENLERLANAYAALNPGWTRPGSRQTPE